MPVLAFFNALSPWHILLIMVAALLIWGNRLPEVARALGRSVNEFKRGLNDISDDIDKAGGDDDEPKAKLREPHEESRVSREKPHEHASVPDDHDAERR